MDLINLFFREKWDEVQKTNSNAKELIKNFVKDYPRGTIRNLSIEEFLLKKDENGNNRSFCHRIRYEMKDVSSMGNAFPNITGVYLKGDRKIKSISKTYDKLSGGDFDVPDLMSCHYIAPSV